ncbi:unnamed protein product [Prunus armeniaca]
MLVPNEQVVESIPLNCIVKPLEEPENMTNIILQALEITGQRGVINRGWGGLGNLAKPSDSVYLVHHGVAGTTAAGLKAACPTTIVPFFGDQPFWGQRVHAIGVGPAPIPAYTPQEHNHMLFRYPSSSTLCRVRLTQSHDA